jgi:hypothetical protein
MRLDPIRISEIHQTTGQIERNIRETGPTRQAELAQGDDGSAEFALWGPQC